MNSNLNSYVKNPYVNNFFTSLVPYLKDLKCETIKNTSQELIMDPGIKTSPILKPEVQKEVDLLTKSRIIKGNAVTLLENGIESFPERYKMMKKAKHSINLQTLIFHSDKTGWKTAKLLAQKAKEGVKVRVIYDWISSVDSDPKVFQFMKQAGVEVLPTATPLEHTWQYPNNPTEVTNDIKKFIEDLKAELRYGAVNLNDWLKEKITQTLELINDPNKFTSDLKEQFPLLAYLQHNKENLNKLNNHWHMKILTVDGQEGIAGGMNIGSEYENGGTSNRDSSQGERSFSTERYLDTDIKVAGAAVKEINKIFAKNHKYAGGIDSNDILTENPPPKIAGGISLRHIFHLPIEEKDKNIENWYKIMFKHVGKTAYITNAYFLPTKEICDALIGAAKRGVDVRIITNSPETNDLPVISHGGRYHYKELLNSGVKIYELKKCNHGNFSTLHSKAAVFDGEVSTVGSSNLDPRSFDKDSENNIVVHDKQFGRKMHKMFKKNLEFCNEMTVKSLYKSPPNELLLRWLGANKLAKQL